MSNVPVVFLQSSLAQIVAEKNINLIETSSFSDLRKYASVEDIAFSFAVNDCVRESLYFQGFQTNLVEKIMEDKKDVVIGGHLTPFFNHLKKNGVVSAFLRGENNEYVMDDILTYSFTPVQGVLVVGVESGFFKSISEPLKAKDFFRDALEACERTIPGSNLKFSDLYAKFVKLSISI